MRRSFALFLFLAVIAGGGAFVSLFEIDGLEGVIVRRRPVENVVRPSAGPESYVIPDKTPGTIRIASFNIQAFGPHKASQPHIMNVIAQTVRRFDILAVQEIRSKDQSLIPALVGLINSTGAKYDFLLGPRLGDTSSKEQYAYLFNTETIDADPKATYTVGDPHHRMHREPFVALFRAHGPDSREAFTFKLVNVHVDPDFVEEELNALDDVYRAVLNDGDEEDDVILIGDFNTSERNAYELGTVPYMATALIDTNTNILGTKAYDNLFFQAQNTVEYIGKSGVLDMLRYFNMTTETVKDVSDHLPVWADFSIYEGGAHGRVATRLKDEQLK